MSVSDPYQQQARLYALRDRKGTDFLAFRAVAESGWLSTGPTLDLGCGAGRSTRFLRDLGHSAIGVDISTPMIEAARALDPAGDYRWLKRKGLLPFPDESFSLLFSSWALLEENDREVVVQVLREAARVLKPDGQAILVTNTPDFYAGNWLTCQVDFPENQLPLRSGQPVRVRLLPEGVDLTDCFWSDEDYRDFFRQAGLSVISTLRPLGRHDDLLPWKDEWNRAPFVIYQLARV